MPCDDTEIQKHRGQGEKSRLVTLSPRNTPSSAWSFVSEPGSMVPTAWCGRDASACHSLLDTAGRPVTWRAPLHVLWVLKGAEHAAVSPMGQQGCQGWEAAVTKRCARGLNPQPCCLRRGTRSPNSDRAGPGDVQPARALHLGTPPPPNGGRSRAGSRVRRAGPAHLHGREAVQSAWAPGPWASRGRWLSAPPALNLRSEVLCGAFSPGPSSTGCRSGGARSPTRTEGGRPGRAGRAATPSSPGQSRRPVVGPSLSRLPRSCAFGVRGQGTPPGPGSVPATAPVLPSPLLVLKRGDRAPPPPGPGSRGCRGTRRRGSRP